MPDSSAEVVSKQFAALQDGLDVCITHHHWRVIYLFIAREVEMEHLHMTSDKGDLLIYCDSWVPFLFFSFYIYFILFFFLLPSCIEGFEFDMIFNVLGKLEGGDG